MVDLPRSSRLGRGSCGQRLTGLGVSDLAVEDGSEPAEDHAVRLHPAVVAGYHPQVVASRIGAVPADSRQVGVDASDGVGVIDHSRDVSEVVHAVVEEDLPVLQGGLGFARAVAGGRQLPVLQDVGSEPLSSQAAPEL